MAEQDTKKSFKGHGNPEKAAEILKFQNVEMSEADQEKLGKPLEDDSGVDSEDQKFLEMLVKKVDSKEIDLHAPSSLINHDVYDELDEQAKGKADYDAVNLLSTIRDIYRLWQVEQKSTYQIQNLVHRIRVTKERIEEAAGDIYII